MRNSQSTTTTTTTTRSSSRLRLGATKKDDDNDNDDYSSGRGGSEAEAAVTGTGAAAGAGAAAGSPSAVPGATRPMRRLQKLEDDSKSSSTTAKSPATSRTTRASSFRTSAAIITPPQQGTEKTTKNKGKKRASSSSPATTSKTVGAAAKRRSTTLTSSNAHAAAAASVAPRTPQSSTQKPTATAKAAPPKGWEDIYSLVVELRQDRTAPCDISGCEALAAGDDNDATNDKNTPSCNSPQEFRFRTLIALMLSSQTKDAVVGAAVRHMIADDVLNIPALLAMPPDRLCNHYLSKVGFRNNKTRYIQETCRILRHQFQDDIPPTAALMMELLPGVGPKMAFICESVAWQRQSGIGVDTHMHRIFALLGWMKQPCKTPEHTRQQLESWLPHSYWADVNLLWVGFGQEVQQEKPKLLRKALACSRPADALHLLKRCGLDCNKEAQKLNLQDEVRQALSLAKK